jgi:hypothetical protein
VETQADSRVTFYPDGKYRWVDEVPMLKNPSILFDVYKVLGISFGIVNSEGTDLSEFIFLKQKKTLRRLRRLRRFKASN